MMRKLDPKSDGASENIIASNIDQLRELFPEVLTESSDEGEPRWKIDFDALRQLLGGNIEEKQERYSFTWNGKARARRIAQTPSTGTLRPCPGESVNWGSTRNLFIEGDNLEVLKLLQKSYHKKVKMIYIDPPYNTGNDFIYPDDFRDNIANYKSLTGQTDEDGRSLTTNAETSGRYHTNWLNMMYPRLKLARNLLRNDGVIFISIDDHELTNLKKLSDEIFGEENFIATFVRKRRMATGMRGDAVSPDHEYVLAFSSSRPYATLFGNERNEDDYPFCDEISKYRSTDLTIGMTRKMRPNQFFSISNPRSGQEYLPPDNRVWRFFPDTMKDEIVAGNIIWPDDHPDRRMSRPRYKTRFNPDDADAITSPVSTWIKTFADSADEEIEDNSILSISAGMNQEATKQLRNLMDGQVIEYPKPVSLLKSLIRLSTTSNDLVMDFFAGSASTAQAVFEQNLDDGGRRSFLMVQLPEHNEKDSTAESLGYKTIADIGKERIRRVIKKISDKRSEPSEKSKGNPAAINEEQPVPDLGFKVFKLDSSNIIPWDADFDNLEDALFNAVESLKPSRSQEDILYELLLKYGLDLAVPIEERSIAGKSVYIIDCGALVVCLDGDIGMDVVQGIAALKKELNPEMMRVIFRDSGFADDVVKTNAVQILRQARIEDVKSL